MKGLLLHVVTGTLLAGLLGNSVTLADGKHFPEKAIKVAPAIPSQRAIIAYKDGVETLMIESALDGAGKEFGWIIPLPDRPTKFEKTSPGFLKTLSLQMQPYIIPTNKDLLGFILVLAIAITGWFIQILVFKPKYPIHHLLFWVFLVFAWCIFFPSLGYVRHFAAAKSAGGPDSISGVTVVDQQEVGDYTVSVLDAKTAEALDQWLNENGLLGLSAQDRPIIDDYISKGWCFVETRLHRPADGFSRPDPISVSFPTDKAIYPMRLTATVGSDIYLELFVISDRSARCSLLPVEVTTQFEHYAIKAKGLPSASQSAREPDNRPYFRSKLFSMGCQHSQADQWLWDDCWVTKLADTLENSRQNVDLEFSFEDSGPYRKEYFSTQSARWWAGTYALSTWTVGIVLLTLIRLKSPPHFLKGLTLSKACVIVLVLSGACYGGLIQFLPSVPVHVASGMLYLPGFDEFELSCILDGFSVGSTESFESVQNRFREFLRLSLLQDPLTGDWKQLEESPGNYEIVKHSGGLVLRKYGLWGRLMEVGITEKGGDGLLPLNDLLRGLSTLGHWDGKGHDIIQYALSNHKGRYQYLIGFLAHLYDSQPQQFTPIILQDLERWVRSQKDTAEWKWTDAVQLELGMLGCITHIQPPREFTNNEAIETYIKKVREMAGQSGS